MIDCANIRLAYGFESEIACYIVYPLGNFC